MNPEPAERQTYQAPISRVWLESEWPKLPVGTQRDYASQMNWDPTSQDTRNFVTAQQNVLQMRRRRLNLTKLQKDMVVTFCPIYGYRYCQ